MDQKVQPLHKVADSPKYNPKSALGVDLITVVDLKTLSHCITSTVQTLCGLLSLLI